MEAHFKGRTKTTIPRKDSGSKSDVIDPLLEVVDPTPNIDGLFKQFNARFFWKQLNGVLVSWSKRLTTAAGVCSFRPTHGICSIRLSQPLLSLRPRKDLVETLLHEMIHAYLFLTNNYKDRDDHGPEFHKHMWRINEEAGTNVTVYHAFHDEVSHYKTHVWRCNGPCQHLSPYYGLVRRAMNRPPGPYDKWWDRHKITCNGHFVKISEPENYKKKQIKGNKEDKKVGNPIMDLFNKSKITTLKDITSFVSETNNNLSNVSNNKSPTTVQERTESSESVRKRVRDIWTTKYPSTDIKKPKLSLEECSRCGEIIDNTCVNHELACQSKSCCCPVCNKTMPQREINEHLESCLKMDFDDDFGVDTSSAQSSVDDVWEEDWENVSNTNGLQICPCCAQKFPKDAMSSHIDECLKFVDDCDTKAIKTVPCPCCNEHFMESQIPQHVEECLSVCAIREGLFDD